MKFDKKDCGVIISGASLYSPLHQGFEIVKFAKSQGFEYEDKLLEEDIKNSSDWSYNEYEDFEYLVEDAVDYLNTKCVEPDVTFMFVDTDFVLVDLDKMDTN